jgi:CRP/FNR family cyclic AMP-dependent transcriptional regulator
VPCFARLLARGCVVDGQVMMAWRHGRKASSNCCAARLARILLLLARFGKEGTPETVVAKISQEMLAEMIGTTRSRVSFFMNRFRKLGFIHYNGGLQVHSSLLNVVLHD